MDTEEKYNLAMDIITRTGYQNDKDIALSIAEGIKKNQFFVEYNSGNMVLFLTWEDNKIDGKRYIFVNNLWIEPNYRSKNTLVRIRSALKFLLKNVYKFYWFNREKQKMIYRS